MSHPSVVFKSVFNLQTSVPVIVAVTITCSACGGEPSASQRRRDVSNLTQTFPVLEEYQVEAYRNQDWCKNIAYQRGKFSNTDRTTCNLFQGDPSEFDTQAQADFDTVAAAIAKSRVKLYYISGFQYDAQEKLIRAEFHLSGDFNRYSYIYEPGYSLPEDLAYERHHTAIDENWYFVWEDWN